MTFITEQLSQREPFYSKARHTIDVSLLNNHDAIDRSVEQVRNIVTQQ